MLLSVKRSKNRQFTLTIVSNRKINHTETYTRVNGVKTAIRTLLKGFYTPLSRLKDIRVKVELGNKMDGHYSCKEFLDNFSLKGVK